MLASNCLLVRESCPSGILNFGSDHRAVESILSDTKKGTQVYCPKKPRVKDWCPQLDLDGKASKYHALLDIPLADSALCFETMEKIIHDAAVSPDVPVQVDEHQKP